MNKTVEKWGLALFFLLGTTLLIKLYAAYVPWGLRWVYTPSIPLGLYGSKTYDNTPLARGQGVCFKANPLPWMAGRDYLTPNEVICKFTLGVPGDTIEPRGNEIFVCHDGQCNSAGVVQAKDYKGRPSQSAFTEKTVIPANQYYFGSTHHPRSFDSRYIGLVDGSAVVVRHWPIWTY
jgi:type IV secretory pathway protease TraF